MEKHQILLDSEGNGPAQLRPLPCPWVRGRPTLRDGMGMGDIPTTKKRGRWPRQGRRERGPRGKPPVLKPHEGDALPLRPPRYGAETRWGTSCPSHRLLPGSDPSQKGGRTEPGALARDKAGITAGTARWFAPWRRRLLAGRTPPHLGVPDKGGSCTPSDAPRLRSPRPPWPRAATWPRKQRGQGTRNPRNQGKPGTRQTRP